MTDETPFRTELLAALDQAREADGVGDHPYGSVIITEKGELAERNRVESTPDPTAHSEVMALRTAALRWGLDSLRGGTLVTSYEPCPMCCSAILNAGISRLVVGARRTVGEPPLGDYNVEALLALTGWAEPIEVVTVELPEIAAYYA
ncbi:MAG TPA: nucleoside deaminase [Marmoricola sp.]|jgi:tRNA(adenine34) deaminase|nr:nucleoside deaminase [Marmoricola sp.]